MRFFRAPSAVQFFLKDLEWRQPVKEKVLYLTFDDGPIPEVTDFVLAQLDKFKAKGTFFCVGENVERYPAIAKRVLQAGHRLGNHTFNHLKGSQSSLAVYLQNIGRCEAAFKNLDVDFPAEQLFRPPYGMITLSQIKALREDYRIIMWDLLTYDFDATFSEESCLKTSISLARPGSIVVFHDSLKARRNLEFVLPAFLKHFHEEGYRFDTL